MKTLELKHLAPYLPYELNGQFEVTDIVPNAKQEIRDKKLTASSIEMFLLYCKPILRPLSDLTKEIEHNGERFVPMVRLLEMDERNEFSKDELLRSFGKGIKVNIISCESKYYKSGPVTVHEVKYAIETSNMGTLVHSFSYDDRFDRFSKRDETRQITLGVGYQLQLFEMLSQWHFDYNQLIDSGLAIDINTLSTNSLNE